MAEASGLSQLSERFECVVCHDTLFNPKDLLCQHSICNDCLDGLVVFEKDGSGTIQCPHGCNGTIKLGANDSVNSILSLNYGTQNVLLLIKESKEK